ncbi:26S proteasome non-ATPase regulatory subunit 12-like [Tropilaelaps mercedesae]|uniref:26S proteasome non-ATPase regulatory subunit 12-like n=1 Tax=Tropilaelaps mercedesae TaxID=418985 RepID=A0A1V9X7N0_9ACAR|nr:26S proteasome non-ATPase regulatory subunit 12-like [Tropilaelaps mercedesae]
MGEVTYNDDGRIVKMEVDYSSTVDAKIPATEALVQQGKLDEALEQLLALEKQTRTGADTHSTSRILVHIAKLCFQAKQLTKLNEMVVTLSKRRSQMKQAIQKMVQECCDYVDKLDGKDKLNLIDTLRTVTAGKIYVEVERARLTYKLSQIKEAAGDIEGAATLMQELQVETFGSMERREKVELILEQMRLCLAREDYSRTAIIAKKISVKFFEEAEREDLKLKYYELMIRLGEHDSKYLDISRHYLAIYNTKRVQEDTQQRDFAIQAALLFCILAPYDNEQNDLLHRLNQDKVLKKLLKFNQLLQLFITPELIVWAGIFKEYEKQLRASTVFNSEARFNDLKKRAVEHNMRVMAKYYTRIRLERMSQLLELPLRETEETLSNLVTNKVVYAKVDRLSNIVYFVRQQKDPEQVLNDWSHNVTSLMKLLCRTTHLINKEEMVHRHLQPVTITSHE